MRDSRVINRNFYDALWAESRLQQPERFNTWSLISELLLLAPERLEIGPGLRPRLPINGTCFVDISPPVIQRLTSWGGIAVLAEITDLPFDNGKFELVCAFDVIEHTEDDQRVFSEVSRVLKAGGAFIFSVPLYGELWTEFDGFVGHVRRYEPVDLTALLAAHDLVIEKSAPFGMQPANPWLVNFGMWWLKRHRREAMWCYNHILMPLAICFQKQLIFGAGLSRAAGVDEIVVVCRKRAGSPAESI